MFQRRMRLLQIISVSLLAGVLITFGIVILAEGGNRYEKIVAGESSVKAAAADSYSIASQADYDAVKRQTSGEYLLIESGVQLASVFRYGGEDALPRKFKVNFVGTVNLYAWTLNGSQATPCIGTTPETAFTGEFDFNGITVVTDNPGGQGLFPYLDGGAVKNLNLLQNAGGCAISAQMTNDAVIENVTAELRLSENCAPSSYWGGIVSANGILSDVNVLGGTVRNCSVTLTSRANKNLLIQNVGLIVGTSVGGRIENCKSVLGNGDFTINRYGGIVSIAADNAVVSGCKAYMLEESNVYTTGGYIGGLCALAQDTATFRDCTVTVNHDGWNKGATQELVGVGGLIGVMNNADATKKISLVDCVVSGDCLYGGTVSGGIVGAQNASAEVTSCKSKFNRIYVSAYAGMMFGGDVGRGWAGSATAAKSFIVTDCISSGDLYAKCVVGGFSGSLEKGCNLTLQNCNVYGSLNYDASIYSSDTRSKMYLGGYVAYTNSNAMFQAKGCGAYITLPSETSFYSGDLLGDTSKGVTVTIEQSTYTKSLGTDYAYQKTFSGKTVLTGTTSVTAALAVQKRSEFEVSFSLQKQMTRLAVSGGVATLTVDVSLSGYTVWGLYLSVCGISSEGATQLVHDGKVVGFMGSAFAYGANVPLTGNRIVFEFKGTPQSERLCAVKLVLIKGDDIVSVWVNAAGDEVYLSS